MTPHKQLFRHKPAEGLFGDCYRTVIACLLDLTPGDVPHFYDGLAGDGDATEAHRARDAWLRERGFALVCWAYKDELANVLNVMQHNNPGLFYILSGFSRTGVNHCVVACGGEIVHDPSQTDAGIIGPMKPDDIYSIEVLVPIAMKAAA